MPLSTPFLSRARPVKTDSLAVLKDVFAAAGAKDIVDIGCGSGALAGQLALAGFAVTGVDPQLAALERARVMAPGVRFMQGTAEDLPADCGPFDAACFVNALHHVVPDRMQDALLQVLSRLSPAGVLVVIEPLAAGSFFRCMRMVDDETEVRAAAIAAIEAVVGSGHAKLQDLRHWDRESQFTGLAGFIEYLIAVDPQRRAAIDAHGPDLARAWRDNLGLKDGKAVLVQPMVCWTLGAAK